MFCTTVSPIFPYPPSHVIPESCMRYCYALFRCLPNKASRACKANWIWRLLAFLPVLRWTSSLPTSIKSKPEKSKSTSAARSPVCAGGSPIFRFLKQKARSKRSRTFLEHHWQLACNKSSVLEKSEARKEESCCYSI